MSSLFLTTLGRALHAKWATQSTPQNLTHIVIGDGANAGSSATALSNERLRLRIESKTVAPGATAQLETRVPPIADAINHTETGVIATDPDIGEVLYAYGHGSWGAIAASTESEVMLRTVRALIRAINPGA